MAKDAYYQGREPGTAGGGTTGGTWVWISHGKKLGKWWIWRIDMAKIWDYTGWWFGTCFFSYVGNNHPN